MADDVRGVAPAGEADLAVRQLLLAEIQGRNSADDTDRLLGSPAETRLVAMHQLLADLMDTVADHESTHGVGTFLAGCQAASARLRQAPDPHDPPVVALLAFLCLNVTLLDRRFEPPERVKQDASDDYCRELFRTTPVSAAVRALYRPGGRPGVSRPISEIDLRRWRDIDFGSLEYHRAGTTSFILRATTREPVDESGLHPALVLKCVLFPWSKLTSVAQATDEYAVRYGAANTPNVVVHPLASTDQWVLMPYQEGETLGDHLIDFESSEPSPGERVAKARQIGLLLTEALHRLARSEPVDVNHRERQHLDLSPGNIILSDGRIHFIDLGVNHLYSRQVGIAEHDDAVYIAPEVKNRGQSEVADVYSLGIILIQVMVGSPARDGRVPDRVYAVSPTIARMLDDFIEEQPKDRLLLLPDRPFRFDDLRRMMTVTFDLAAQESEASRSALRRWAARLAPASREVRTQYRQLRVARAANVTHDTYLMGFALVATACWWFICAKTALWKVDDVLTFSNKPLPPGDLRAAVIIGFCQALVGAKYYQSVLARLTARHIPGALARVTEVAVRAMCVVALPTVLLSVFWKPALWAWGCAAGAVAVSVTNLLLLLLSRRILRAGATSGLSTVPPASSGVARGFEQWWWTMLLYAAVICVIAVGLQAGFLHDRDAYVFGLVLISVGIHYVSKFVTAGYEVRGGLSRALSVGERLSALHRADPARVRNWPPRLVAPRRPAEPAAG
ncbi:protein kinase domain-containing protein [Micromonospora sp. DT31]|uniref:protein kinase domain-containing protein n=1 Tax=Micromonospora sp. DT31 TaxID=3393434 RepID=UPI003CF66929